MRVNSVNSQSFGCRVIKNDVLLDLMTVNDEIFRMDHSSGQTKPSQDILTKLKNLGDDNDTVKFSSFVSEADFAKGRAERFVKVSINKDRKYKLPANLSKISTILESEFNKLRVLKESRQKMDDVYEKVFGEDVN